MALDSKKRRELSVRSHSLKAHISIGKAGLTEAITAQIDQAFGKTDLVKVRILEKDKAVAKTLADQLTETLACELASLTGFVVTLYRSGPAPASTSTSTVEPPPSP